MSSINSTPTYETAKEIYAGMRFVRHKHRVFVVNAPLSHGEREAISLFILYKRFSFRCIDLSEPE